jgi:hypothetical protein
MKMQKNRLTSVVALVAMVSLVSPKASALEPCAIAGIVMMTAGSIGAVIGSAFMINAAVDDESCAKTVDPHRCREDSKDQFNGGAWGLGSSVVVALAGGITYALGTRSRAHGGGGTTVVLGGPVYSSSPIPSMQPDINLNVVVDSGMTSSHSSHSSHMSLQPVHVQPVHLQPTHHQPLVSLATGGGHVGGGRSVELGRTNNRH